MSFINNADIIVQNGNIIPYEENYNKYIFQDCKDKWITKDGNEIEIKNMSKLHIANSMKMIEKICELEDLNVNSYNIYKLLKEECKIRE